MQRFGGVHLHQFYSSEFLSTPDKTERNVIAKLTMPFVANTTKCFRSRQDRRNVIAELNSPFDAATPSGTSADLLQLVLAK